MKILALIGLPLTIVSGCTASNPTVLPEVVSYRSPADAHSGIRPQHPQPVVRGYVRREIIFPDKWRERNAEPTSGAKSSWLNQNTNPKSKMEEQS